MQAKPITTWCSFPIIFKVYCKFLRLTQPVIGITNKRSNVGGNMKIQRRGLHCISIGIDSNEFSSNGLESVERRT